MSNMVVPVVFGVGKGADWSGPNHDNCSGVSELFDHDERASEFGMWDKQL